MTPAQLFYSPAAATRLNDERQAILSRDYALLAALLANGLNPNIAADDGRTLAHDAVLMDPTGTALDILARYHADLNARWTQYLNWTPAHIAWFMGRAGVVEKLRRLGADLTLRDSRGWSADHALPCPITKIEANRKLGGLSRLLGRTRAQDSVFA